MYHFIPISSKIISYKKTSNYAITEISYIIPINKKFKEIYLNIKKMENKAYSYDRFWWVGITAKINEHDRKVKFKHPHRVAKNFYWPKRDNECRVLNSEVILYYTSFPHPQHY